MFASPSPLVSRPPSGSGTSSATGPARSPARSERSSARSARHPSSGARSRAGEPVGGRPSSSPLSHSCSQRSRSFQCSAISSRLRSRRSACGSGGVPASAMQGFASLPATKALLIVIDGLTPAMFEDAVERRAAPTLAELFDRGSYTRAVSVFPSLTPVCLSSLMTGAYPDVPRIPHLVWYHRGEQRLVEYGSSFAALRRAGTRKGIVDAIFNMNAEHLSREAVTLFESVEDAGLDALEERDRLTREMLGVHVEDRVDDPLARA